MSNPVDFSVKPFTKGVLKDIPVQFMPMGGLTKGEGVRIMDAYIERRKGFRNINDCKYEDYILGIKQYADPNFVPHVFFGDINHLYHLAYTPSLRYWDDGYPWWDISTYTWDAIAGGVVYALTPWGAVQQCPLPGSFSSSESSSSESSSSESSSSSSVSSHSNSSSESCALTTYPFSGRDHRTLSGETSSWIFTDFAGNIIATNYEDPIVLIRGYAYDRYENLTCLGLHARIVDVFQNHVMALNTIDPINGAMANRYWWSGLDDAEDWDYLSLSSECGYTDLEPSSAPITGGAKLRDSYIIYQQNMIHQLNYTGGTLVFSRQVINNEIGCISKGLLCGDGEKHFFFAQNDIWMFDGYNFKPIGMNNNAYIYGGLNRAQISRAFSFIDTNTDEVHLVIPWQSEIPNLDCIYDYVHDLWTYDWLGELTSIGGATAGCPKAAFDFPFIARVDVNFCESSSSSSYSISASESSSSTSSTSMSISSSSMSSSSSSKSSSSSSKSSSSSSSISTSSSSTSSSDSFSSEVPQADSYIQEVGSTMNDNGCPRNSEWISGEYTTFNEEVPINQYIKEVREFTPVVVELINDIEMSIGARDRTDTTTIINWEVLAPFTDQELVGTTTYGRYLSFRCIANNMDDYYKISELMGSYVITGRR